jgi:Flp pilus assembly protein CpaB
MITTAIRGSTTPIVVAVHAISPGAQISATDVKLVEWPVEYAPPEAFNTLAEVVGRRMVSRVSEGVPLTNDGFTIAAIRDDTTAEVLVPVRTRDTAMLTLLHPGALVTLVGVAPEGYAETLATQVRVVSLPDSIEEDAIMGGSIDSGALIVIACRRADAITIAGAAGMTITIIIE